MGDHAKVEETENLLNGDHERVNSKTERTIPKRMIVVEPIVFIYLVAGVPYGMIFSQYLYRRVGESMGINVDNLTLANSSQSDCDIDLNDTNYIQREAVQAQTSLWTLYIDLACFFPGFFAFLVFGTMSDRVGRKFLFILPPIGSLFKAILAAAIIKFHLPIWVFFFNAFEYCLGSFDLLQLACLAYLADTTNPRYLAVRMTVLQVIVDLSGGIADMGVGIWIKNSGYFWPTLFVCCGKTCALLYAIFFIPETITNRSKSKRIKCEDCTRTFQMYKSDNGSGRLWKLRLLTFAYFISYVTSSKHGIKLMIMNNPLCWGPLLVGYYSGLNYGMKSVGNIIVAISRGCTAVAEEWYLLLSRVSSVIEYVYLPLVQNNVMMFLAPVIGVLSYAGDPMTRAILSRYVGLDEQGALFAALTVLDRLCLILGTVEANNIYAATIFILQGRLIYFITAAANLVAVICITVFIIKTREERHRRKEIENYRKLVHSKDDNSAQPVNYDSIN